VNLGPVQRGVGGRTRRACRCHLLALLDRFAKRSRAERPDGSLLACAGGAVATPIHPITAWLSLFPSSCTSWCIAVTSPAVTPLGAPNRSTTFRLFARVG